MERDLKIFRGQCLNIAVESVKSEGLQIMRNLEEIFKRAEEIYKKGKELKFPDLV